MRRPLELLRTNPSKATTAPSAGAFRFRDDFIGRDAFAHQAHQILGDGARLLTSALATADGGEKADFVIGGERRLPFREFLIERGHHGIAECGETRETISVAGVEVGYAGALGEFGDIFGAADDVLQLSEEKHAHAHGSHSIAVARGLSAIGGDRFQLDMGNVVQTEERGPRAGES